MKKWISLLLALAIVFSFAMCGGDNNSATPVETDDTATDDTATDDGAADDDYPVDNDDYSVLDDDLCGRWRNSDGGTLQFDDSGVISSCDFKCWSSWFGTPDRIYWEAYNGRVSCSSYFDVNMTYEISQSANGYDNMLVAFSDTADWTDQYRRTSGSTGDGIIGTWANATGTSQTFEFYEDGTGMENGKFSLTWSPYTTDEGISAIIYSRLESTYFDYSVTGNLLTIFLSDGSRTYTKVGN